MKLENDIFGSLSFSFFIGYFTLILTLSLLLSAKTPIYSEVALSVQNIPLSTLLLTSPLAVIIGIIVNCARCTINKFILHRSTYALESVGDDLKELIIPTISTVSKTQTSKEVLLNEESFLNLKILTAPKFDEYSIKSRWIHDFLDTTIYISILCIIIVLFRSAIKSFNGIELYILVMLSCSSLFAFLSLKELKIKYTKSEASIIVTEHSTKQ